MREVRKIREVSPMPEPQLPAEKTNVVSGSLWMLGITLLLFFVPPVNGLIVE